MKAKTEGPAAYVVSADEPRPGGTADMLNLLKLQGVEASTGSLGQGLSIAVGLAKAAGIAVQ